MSSNPDTAWLSHGESTAMDEPVGTTIREYRLAAAKPQAAVAVAMGMTQQHLSQIEKGARPVSMDLRRRFAQVLGIPLEQLGLVAHHRSAASDQTAAEISASRGRWRAQRAWLNSHRSELARMAVELHPVASRVPRTSLIAGEGWVPAAPLELSSIGVELTEEPLASGATGGEDETLAVRPLRAPNLHFDRYTSAIRHLDPPRLFESRPSYRFLGGSLGKGPLRFGMAAYFDKLDVSEALGHEIALACMNAEISTDAVRDRLPFRELIGDPFDPKRRAIIPAITTLTIRMRRHPQPPSFLLHWRDPAKVATAGGIYDVVPAGEFQPSSVALWDRGNDFDLWRNIVREYSEELLGAPEHDGTRTAPIDYDGWPLFQRLTQARLDGTVTAFTLGMGLDALTLAATILTVVVIDDDVFTEVFGETVRYNEEGEIVAIGDGRSADGVPFTEETVDRMLSREPMASPGAACLALAWEHRDHLL